MKTIIITPVGNSCNLSCAYCYHNTKSVINSENVISFELLEIIISETLKNENKVKYIWHGGEPMLAGKPFYEKVIFFQKKYLSENQIIQNLIQTNFTLLTHDYAKFFKENNFKVGISLDGTKEINDKYRKFKNGYGTFSKIIDNIKIAKDINLELGLLVTVNLHNVKYPKEIFYNTINLGFNSIDFNIVSNSKFKATNDNLKTFLTTIFDLWFNLDNENFHIRSFENIIKSMISDYRNSICSYKVNGCDQFIAINEFGKLFPCNRFLNENDFCIGTIVGNNFESIIKTKKYIDIQSNITVLPDNCKNCEFLFLCGGGCGYDRLFSQNFLLPYCDVRKYLFEHIKNEIYKKSA